MHDNIKAFGGDPEKVTIMGQSAGAFNVWMQMRGEEVYGQLLGQGEGKRLFRGAIEMSGAPASLALKGIVIILISNSFLNREKEKKHGLLCT